MSALLVLRPTVTPWMVFAASTPSVGSLAPEFTGGILARFSNTAVCVRARKQSPRTWTSQIDEGRVVLPREQQGSKNCVVGFLSMR